MTLSMNKLKQILLVACLMFGAAYSGQAQTEKGHLMLGLHSSGLRFSIRNGSYSLSIAPEGGYFLANRLAVGTSVGFSVGQELTSSHSGGAFSLWLNPFLRYYIPFTERLSFPVNVSFGAGFSWQTGDFYYNSTGIGGSAMAGVAIFPSKDVSIDFLGGYRLSHSTSSFSAFPPTTRGAFVANYGATWYFGK